MERVPTIINRLGVMGCGVGGILERVLEPGGQVRGFVNIYIGETNVKALGGLDAPLPDPAVISIVPAVAGGST